MDPADEHDPDDAKGEGKSKSDRPDTECPVCLQTCVHPTLLPCGHVFCFLCVKGVSNQCGRCPMCRKQMPADLLRNPKLLDAAGEADDDDDGDGGPRFQWYYEGKNGWWKYDPRTNADLDEAFRSDRRTCELLIAGLLYVVDFDSMAQLRRNDPTRKRKIKRDAVSAPSKGVGGIRIKSRPERPDRPEDPSPSSRTRIDLQNVLHLIDGDSEDAPQDE